MPITTEDFQELASSFFEAVRDGIKSESEIASHCAHPNLLFVAPDGTCLTVAMQRQLHQKFLNEKHTLGHFDLVQICEKPERARAKGWVYFETRYKANPEKGLLKSIVFEDYILERCPDGKVRFVQYNSVTFATLPDSIPFDITL